MAPGSKSRSPGVQRRVATLTIAVMAIAAAAAISANRGLALTGGDEAPSADEAAAPGKARDDVWPKPVGEFLAGEYLNKADVILTRRSGDIGSSVIRWATNSIFSHAALVYTAPPFDPGLSGTFVIEAGTSGVDLTKIIDYASGDHADFVAIRRLKPNAWFNAARQARVRGVLLDKIKAKYDFWTIWKIARNIWFGVQTKIGSKQKTVERYRANDWEPPNEYICTGLVQIGFVEMLVEAIKRGEVSPEALRDVVFNKTAEGYLPEPGNWKYLGDDAKQTAINFRDILRDELYAVTPEDLAQTDKLDWLYLIRNGAVYKVSAYADVLKIVNQ
ncbi:MAG: hypothetical protein K2X41_10420 [Hyphomicrobium sp.]|nr:hypothetical protein [Hyphomicrobium sp.]